MNNDRFKFRAWNKNTGKMIDLNLITPLALSESRDGVFIPFSEEFIVMQCTGLKDKNDKLIYEGDLYKQFDDRFERLFKIRFGWFEDGGIEIRGKDFTPMNVKMHGWYVKGIYSIDKVNDIIIKNNLMSWAINNNNLKNMEIIGNKFENSELLEDINDK